MVEPRATEALLPGSKEPSVTQVPSETPQHTQDSSCCKFLGRDGCFDLYWCSQGGRMPTVIARWSSDGPDYISGLPFADIHPQLGEAKVRAMAAGYRCE